jgi:DNA-binding response OmpR family regulator
MSFPRKEEVMNRERPHVLICDADPDILIHLEQVLEDAGFDTTSTWNAADLERLLAHGSFQFLIIGDHALANGCRIAHQKISR